MAKHGSLFFRDRILRFGENMPQSLNYPEPLWTHLNQEKANVYPFRA